MSKISLNTFRAIARAYASGCTIWCVETGEGFLREGGCSLNNAKRALHHIMSLFEERNTFYRWDE